MWQVNDDGLSSLLDVAELLGVRGLKSDRRPEAWIRGSGSGFTPKCHGSGTLAQTFNMYPCGR
jgi:hypothetical protein